MLIELQAISTGPDGGGRSPYPFDHASGKLKLPRLVTIFRSIVVAETLGCCHDASSRLPRRQHIMDMASIILTAVTAAIVSQCLLSQVQKSSVAAGGRIWSVVTGWLGADRSLPSIMLSRNCSHGLRSAL